MNMWDTHHAGSSVSLRGSQYDMALAPDLEPVWSLVSLTPLSRTWQSARDQRPASKTPVSVVEVVALWITR